MAQGQRTDVTFAVPVTNGNYAPEIVHLRQAGGGAYDFVAYARLLVVALPASSAIELGYYAADGTTWRVVQSLTATGLGALMELCGMRGLAVRARSGGSAGTATVTAVWQ